MWILWPLSRLIEFLVKRRRNKYLQNLQLSWKPDIPLIVVGNIVVGGSGKTPFVIWLSKLLEDQGYKPGIVSRGYGSKSNQYPLIIDNDSRVADSGDEPFTEIQIDRFVYHLIEQKLLRNYYKKQMRI